MIFSNINNSFYFTLYVINRFLIYSKMLLLFFEYSKTGLQKEFFFMLNLIFIQRLSNLPDLDKIDYYLNKNIDSLHRIFDQNDRKDQKRKTDPPAG